MTIESLNRGGVGIVRYRGGSSGSRDGYGIDEKWNLNLRRMVRQKPTEQLHVRSRDREGSGVLPKSRHPEVHSLTVARLYAVYEIAWQKTAHLGTWNRSCYNPRRAQSPLLAWLTPFSHSTFRWAWRLAAASAVAAIAWWCSGGSRCHARQRCWCRRTAAARRGRRRADLATAGGGRGGGAGGSIRAGCAAAFRDCAVRPPGAGAAGIRPSASCSLRALRLPIWAATGTTFRPTAPCSLPRRRQLCCSSLTVVCASAASPRTFAVIDSGLEAAIDSRVASLRMDATEAVAQVLSISPRDLRWTGARGGDAADSVPAGTHFFSRAVAQPAGASALASPPATAGRRTTH